MYIDMIEENASIKVLISKYNRGRSFIYKTVKRVAFYIVSDDEYIKQYKLLKTSIIDNKLIENYRLKKPSTL
jgi:hypothetical protein